MLNPFPELLVFGLAAIFAIRVFLGVFFVRFGILKLKKDGTEKLIFLENIGMKHAVFYLYSAAILEIIGGSMLIIGLYTQIASIALSVLAAGALLIKVIRPHALKNDLWHYALVLITTLSLLFLGAGVFAFDLPL